VSAESIRKILVNGSQQVEILLGNAPPVAQVGAPRTNNPFNLSQHASETIKATHQCISVHVIADSKVVASFFEGQFVFESFPELLHSGGAEQPQQELFVVTRNLDLLARGSRRRLAALAQTLHHQSAFAC
jgi:hypothetical protein